jgi:hypothetical protein
LSSQVCRYEETSIIFSQGSTAEDGDESSDEQTARNYSSCKPLALYSAVKVESSAEVDGGAKSKEHILLANENMYIFFRYHR